MKLKQFILVLMLSLTGLIAKAQTIHVLMFICDEVNDRIYKSCQVDKKLIKSEIKTISTLTNIPVKYHYTSFSKKSLKEAISKLTVTNEDIVLFYYSGHGYNLGNTKFPNMNFRSISNSNLHVNLNDVHLDLKRKGARFTITLGDLCNNTIRSNQNLILNGRKRRLGYVKLFKHYKGDIIMASSQKGEYSVGDDRFGGFFTKGFVTALRYCVNNGIYRWEDLLKKAQNNTSELFSRQKPVYEYNLKHVSQGYTPGY